MQYKDKPVKDVVWTGALNICRSTLSRDVHTPRNPWDFPQRFLVTEEQPSGEGSYAEKL